MGTQDRTPDSFWRARRGFTEEVCSFCYLEKGIKTARARHRGLKTHGLLGEWWLQLGTGKGAPEDEARKA